LKRDASMASESVSTWIALHHRRIVTKRFSNKEHQRRLLNNEGNMNLATRQ
jgi:hypothetical protein